MLIVIDFDFFNTKNEKLAYCKCAEQIQTRCIVLRIYNGLKTDLPTFLLLSEHLQPEIFLRLFHLNLYAIHNEELIFSKFLVDNAPEEIGKLASLQFLSACACNTRIVEW